MSPHSNSISTGLLKMARCPHCNGSGKVARFSGEKFRSMRKRLGLSLREVARRAKCSPAFLSDFELGRRQPSTELMERLYEQIRYHEWAV